MRWWWIFLLAIFLWPSAADAALINRVNEAHRAVHGRNPTVSEWSYWAGRIQRGEKKTFTALVGAMGYQKAQGSGAIIATSPVSGSASAAVATRKAPASQYPSPHNPNFLPDGTLVKSTTSGNVYYIRGGKKSWVIPSLINKWLGENHFFKHDIITTVSPEDLARYPQASSVNHIYVGKILIHPNGTQFFIDDKLRRRHIPAAVRTKLRVPGGNSYPTSAAHLREFKTGPTLTGTSYPGGFVLYTGAYHGGKIWRFKEVKSGTVTRHLYLSDYLYEADGNPDESLRAPAVPELFNKHSRGANIERYPDGWVVGLGGKIFVTQGGKLRHITTPDLFNTMGYKQKYVLKVFPEFLRRYPHGTPIRAFKSIAQLSAAPASKAKAAPNTANNLTKVRPAVRALIASMNTTYISVFDKDPTPSENKFWVDYVYNGEVKTKAALIDKMQEAKRKGKKPPRTSRTATRPESELQDKWFPYLFYFVHQSEPSEAAKDYWHGRIRPGDRDTIEKLGGTLQWLKDTSGLKHK